MRRGFTLIELLVVIAMLMLLMGSVSSAVSKARRRAAIAKATTDCQEMTNAILAYENYARDHKLTTMDQAKANEANLGFILGKGGQSDTGDEVPVLFNAALQGSEKEIRDPWGNPYLVTIKEATVNVNEDDLVNQLKGGNLTTGVTFPNYWRRRGSEQ